jgi:hypothetical protein
LRNTSSKKTGKGTRERTCTVEVGNACGKVLGHVPESAKIHCTRVESSLEDTEKHSDSQKFTEAFDNTVKGHDDTPDKYETTEVDGWACKLLQKHVARNLKQDVRDEEQTEDDVVLVANKVQILNKAFDLGVSNVCSVEMRDEV